MIGNIKDSIDAVRGVVDSVKDNQYAKVAGHEAGKAIVTVSKAVNTFLLPIAAVNFGCDKAKIYFSEKFENEFSEKMKNVAPEDIMVPKSSIAGQALQGLAFSHEEFELKEMYLSLLASASNRKSASSVHPSYVQIIREMSSDEAKILASRYVFGSIPVADIQLHNSGGGFFTIARNVSTLAESAECDCKDMGTAYIDNLCRLGVFEIRADQHILSKSAYDFVESHPFYKQMQDMVSKDQSNGRVSYKKKLMSLTSLGTLFIRTCIPS